VIWLARLPQQWFLNTPVLWLGALFLAGIARGSLRNVPTLVRNLLKFLTVSCFAVGMIILLMWNPVLQTAKHNKPLGPLWILLLGATLIWWIVSFIFIFLPRHQKRGAVLPASIGSVHRLPSKPAQAVRSVPTDVFADFGGMEQAKEQIQQLVLGHLHPEKYKRYGLIRNGILLYGPRGTGKTFLARATAGEFGLHFEYISGPQLLNRWIGATTENIQGMLAQATARVPVLFFIDEIDSLGAGRQDCVSDSGGAGREFNNITLALMSSIDRYRTLSGFVLMAATNRLDVLDEALIREGRFDVKIRLDLPDEATRLQIFEAQLRAKPWKPFDLREFAQKTPGASAAKLRSLVDQAANYALTENRKIEVKDLRLALERNGGRDRPQLEKVGWDEVVVADSIKQDLQSIIRLLEDPVRTRALGLEVPTGLLLIGPPGTGKTLIASLIASQTSRSFYPLTAAAVLGGGVGDSVKRVAEVFARAKEHSPSLVSIDEVDGLVPANNRYLNQHDVQLVEQFLIEISNLQQKNNVFLVGTTNHPENIDPRVLRGGRFSEKLQIPLPDAQQTVQLLTRYLQGVRLEPALTVGYIANRLAGFAPADLQAICTAAKRMAFNRGTDSDQLPPLTGLDFERAAERVRVAC